MEKCINRCDLNEMLSGNEKCGRLIDVIKIGLKFKDTITMEITDFQQMVIVLPQMQVALN